MNRGADFARKLRHIEQMINDIALSAAAARQINYLSQVGGHRVYLRVAVEGGGCSGFQYKLDLVEAPQAGDTVIGHNEAHALIDEVSLPLLKGSVIDYAEALIGAQFKIINPNAASSCGCGISFSL
jgi:iron-sulfur cluster insertion protein